MRGKSIESLLGITAPIAAVLFFPRQAAAEGNWEITPESEQALQRGLEWLAKTRGRKATGPPTTWGW